MNQYRKKPVVIEAMQYNGNAADIITWAQQNHQTITGGFGELQILNDLGERTFFVGDLEVVQSIVDGFIDIRNITPHHHAFQEYHYKTKTQP